MAVKGQTVDELIAAYMRANKVPGLSVAVAQTPYITRITGYGFSDSERKLLVSTNTLFALGRLSEAFTAVAVLQLVEQGKVKLDDVIEQHVPLAPQAWHGVTVRQLLQHQSGLPDYMKATPRNPNDPPAELFTAVSETAPTFPPGTKVLSSATDYLLLQLLVETASGQSYETFVRANQFDRLDLKTTFFAGELSSLPRELPEPNERHREYLKNPKLINPIEAATAYGGDEPNPTAAPTRAAIFMSAGDLAIWGIAMSGEILIKNPELRKLLFTPAKLKDGRQVPTSGPWYFPGHPGLMVASAYGQGFSSLLARFTADKELVSVTLLANKEGLDLEPLAREIAGAYDPGIGSPAEVSKLLIRQSPYSATETLVRVEVALRENGITEVKKSDKITLVDNKGKTFPAKEEFIATIPLVESKEPGHSLNLALPLTAWERNGRTWIAVTDPVEAARASGIKDKDSATQKIRTALDLSLARATSADSLP